MIENANVSYSSISLLSIGTNWIKIYNACLFKYVKKKDNSSYMVYLLFHISVFALGFNK